MDWHREMVATEGNESIATTPLASAGAQSSKARWMAVPKLALHRKCITNRMAPNKTRLLNWRPSPLARASKLLAGSICAAAVFKAATESRRRMSSWE
eukprot:11252605-Alexandrium_andersonii.AAC.1